MGLATSTDHDDDDAMADRGRAAAAAAAETPAGEQLHAPSLEVSPPVTPPRRRHSAKYLRAAYASRSPQVTSRAPEMTSRSPEVTSRTPAATSSVDEHTDVNNVSAFFIREFHCKKRQYKI